MKLSGAAGYVTPAMLKHLWYVSGLLSPYVAISLLVRGVELLKLMFSICLASESSWLVVNDVALYVFHFAVADNVHIFAKVSNSVVLSSSTHLLNRGTIWGCRMDSSCKYLRALWTFPVLSSMSGPSFLVTYLAVSFGWVSSDSKSAWLSHSFSRLGILYVISSFRS